MEAVKGRPVGGGFNLSENAYQAEVDSALADGAAVGRKSELFDLGPVQRWLVVTTSTSPKPWQGWKLHVSSDVFHAETVLAAALPVLCGADVDFKLAASPTVLMHLNSARGGPSQVGKFITVYPYDDGQAVELAAALSEATTSLRGPSVPSDRQLRPGSIVYYRYGAFTDRYDVQTPIGEILPAVIDPGGSLVPDIRGQAYFAPDWAEDPFLASGLAQPLPAPSSLVAGRYLVVAGVYRSSSTVVQMAVDVVERRRCLLKRAHAGSLAALDGRDSVDRLEHEAEILARLQGVSGCVQRRDTVADSGETVLVLEDVEGQTIEQRVVGAFQAGDLPQEPQLRRWAIDLATVLGEVHARGIVHRDVKPANVIVGPSGELTLIDYNVSRRMVRDDSATVSAWSEGTLGYMSPQQAAGAAPTAADDVYGLGSLLYFAATGAQPAQTPQAVDHTSSRSIAVMRPDLNGSVADVVDGCLRPDPVERFGSMDEVIRAMSASGNAVRRPARPDPGHNADRRRDHYRGLAEGLTRTLIGAARPAPNGTGLGWLCTHASARGFRSRDLGMGGAGAVLALADLVAGLHPPGGLDVLAKGVDWLSVAPSPGGDRRAGLYVGEGGIGAALLRAGQVLGQPQTIDEALSRGRVVADLPYGSPDIYNGTAGRLRYHVLLYAVTGEEEALAAARAAANALLDAAEETAGGGLCWRIPQGYSDMSGQTYLGYAHGAAGIADALLDLAEVCPQDADRCIAAAQRAARWLSAHAHHVLGDSGALSWADRPEGALATPMWCHGATGIGQFFLHALQLGCFDAARDMAVGAARATSALSRASGPVQCHGLAGSIEFFLDMYQATSEPDYLADAYAFASLLEAFGFLRDGELVWCADYPTLVTPDYMIGYAGIAATLQRLAEPDRRPRQLSLRGFLWA